MCGEFVLFYFGSDSVPHDTLLYDLMQLERHDSFPLHLMTPSKLPLTTHTPNSLRPAIIATHCRRLLLTSTSYAHCCVPQISPPLFYPFLPPLSPTSLSLINTPLSPTFHSPTSLLSFSFSFPFPFPPPLPPTPFPSLSHSYPLPLSPFPSLPLPVPSLSFPFLLLDLYLKAVTDCSNPP